MIFALGPSDTCFINLKKGCKSVFKCDYIYFTTRTPNRIQQNIKGLSNDSTDK